MSRDIPTYDILEPLHLKPLFRAWAKIEILLGLICVFLGMLIVFGPDFIRNPLGFKGVLAGGFLFTLGAYLAMAGHRSHLYQSNNLLTAFLVEEIRKIKEKVG